MPIDSFVSIEKIQCQIYPSDENNTDKNKTYW